MLEALDGLPRFGRHFVNELSLVARKNTPAARSGRPRIPADKEKAVVDFIQDRQLRFYAETLSENQRKAAIKYKTSPRTARRIWERRFTPHLTGEDITQFFVTHFATLLSQTEADQLKLSADPQVKQTATDLSLPAKP